MLRTSALPTVPIRRSELAAPATFTEAFGAQWEQESQQFAPTGVISGWTAQQQAKRYGSMATQEYTPEQAEAMMRNEGLNLKFDRPVNGIELRLLRSRHLDRIRQEEVLERATSFSGVTGRLAGMLAREAVDPLNWALAFIPFVPKAGLATFVGRATSAAGRFGRRAAVGAYEGAMGNLMFEPLVAAGARDYQVPYGWKNTAANVALGGAFGGLAHGVAGGISDFRAKRATAAFDRSVKALTDYNKGMTAAMAAGRDATLRQRGLRSTVDYDPHPVWSTKYDLGDITAGEMPKATATRADLEAHLNQHYEALRGKLRGQSQAGPVAFREAADLDLRRLESRWERADTIQEKAELLQLDMGEAAVRIARDEALAAIDDTLSKIALIEKTIEARVKRVAAEEPPAPTGEIFTAERMAGVEKVKENAARELRRLQLRRDALYLQRKNLLEERARVSAAAFAPDVARITAQPLDVQRELQRAGLAQWLTSDQPVRMNNILDAVEGDPTAMQRVVDDAKALKQPMEEELALSREGDEFLAEAGDDDFVSAQKDLDEATKEIESIQELRDSDVVFAEIEEAAEFAKKADDMTKALRLLTACKLT